jgi:hypothetical protein
MYKTFLFLKHRIKRFAPSLKVRDKTLQSWHSPSLLIFYHPIHIWLLCFQFDYEILSKFNKRKLAREQLQENDCQAANAIKA